jgi:hypothetical protein
MSKTLKKLRLKPTPGQRVGIHGDNRRPKLASAKYFGWLDPKDHNGSLGRAKERVVMISDEEYARLIVKSHQPKSIVQFFANRRSSVAISFWSEVRIPDAILSYERIPRGCFRCRPPSSYDNDCSTRSHRMCPSIMCDS